MCGEGMITNQSLPRDEVMEMAELKLDKRNERIRGDVINWEYPSLMHCQLQQQLLFTTYVTHLTANHLNEKHDSVCYTGPESPVGHKGSVDFCFFRLFQEVLS